MDEQVRPMRVQSFVANNLQVSENGRSGGSGKENGARSRAVGRGRVGRCKFFLLRSVLASDAPAHPRFLCVVTAKVKMAKKKW